MDIRFTLAGDAIAASLPSRTLGGVVVRYGKYGLTSKGKLKVAPKALIFPDDLGIVKLTKEHDNAHSRGHLASVEDDGTAIRASLKVSDGPEGDDALREATDRTRDGLSFYITDAVVDGDTITSGRVVAIGQVGIPAYVDDGRIDLIAAALHPTGDTRMNAEQRARLAELRAKNERTTDEETEFQTLAQLAVDEAVAEPEPAAEPEPEPAAEPTAIAASMPAIPAGLPGRATTAARPRSLRQVCEDLAKALQPGNPTMVGDISAALSDITSTAHTGNVDQPQWVGELWSGMEYEPEWSDLYAMDTLTHYEGQGWRFTQKLMIDDYAGDKAEIPTGTVTTQKVEWDAARAAIGVDIDRKFYDFPSVGFVEGLVRQVRESWEILKDEKVRTHALSVAAVGTRTASVTTANGDATVTAATGTFSAADVGATITGTGIPASTTILSVTNSGSIELSANATASATVTATIGAQAATILKAAARASLILKRRRVGKADWVVVNDEDMMTLMDVTEDDVPAFLDLWGIEPRNFRSSADIPRGTILAGRKQANRFRQLPGSPIRVSAQDIAHGGVDEAFFAYWAIEEHHASGLVSVKVKQPA